MLFCLFNRVVLFRLGLAAAAAFLGLFREVHRFVVVGGRAALAAAAVAAAAVAAAARLAGILGRHGLAVSAATAAAGAAAAAASVGLPLQDCFHCWQLELLRRNLLRDGLRENAEISLLRLHLQTATAFFSLFSLSEMLYQPVPSVMSPHL